MSKLLTFCILMIISLTGFTKVRLFKSNEALDAEIQLDLTYFRAHREVLREKGIPGKMVVGAQSFEVEVLSRGQGSMDNHHSPFKLVFKKSENKGSLFEGIKKIKAFVEPQGETSQNQRQVLSNYLLYKLVEKVTPYAFKTKMFNLKYIDTSNNIPPFESLTFLKEPNKNIAKRFNMTYIAFKYGNGNDPIAMKIKDKVDLKTVELVTAFEFIAGNFDNAIPGIYSDIFKGPAQTEKNMKMIKDQNNKYYPVMYDFDFSGFMDRNYCWWEIGYGVTLPGRDAHYPNVKDICDGVFIEKHFEIDLNNYYYKENVKKYYPLIRSKIIEWRSENAQDLIKLSPSYLNNIDIYLRVLDKLL